MTSLGVSAILQMVVLGAPTEDYAAAHKQTMETGRPMVVLVGAEWCPACQVMKQDVVPQVRKQGLLRKVAFALVDLDREQKLGAELTRGGPIPQLLMFRRNGESWRVRRLIGGQSVQSVESFIEEELKTAPPPPERAASGSDAAPEERSGQTTAARPDAGTPHS